jgi:hypothetical protein
MYDEKLLTSEFLQREQDKENMIVFFINFLVSKGFDKNPEMNINNGM